MEKYDHVDIPKIIEKVHLIAENEPPRVGDIDFFENIDAFKGNTFVFSLKIQRNENTKGFPLKASIFFRKNRCRRLSEARSQRPDGLFQ